MGVRGLHLLWVLTVLFINSDTCPETDFQPENAKTKPNKQKLLHKNKPQHEKWIGEVLKNQCGK